MKLKKLYALCIAVVLLCCSFPPVVSFANDDYPPADFTTKRMNNVAAVQKLVDLATKYNTVYVNGTVGQKLTNDLINKTINYTEGNQYRAARNKLRVPYNYYAFDCSGMVKALFLWAWEGDYYVYNGNEEKNESGLWDLCEQYDHDTQFTRFASYDSILPGEFLYKSGHCGIYIGGGYAVECTADWNSGVQITRIVLENEPEPDKSEPARRWTKHGKLPFINYTYTDLYHKSSAGKLQLNKSTYNPGEPIQVTVKGLNSSVYSDAYVAIYSMAFPAPGYNALSNWCYVGSGTHDRPEKVPSATETVYLDAKTYKTSSPQVLPVGTYKIMLYSDDDNGQILDSLTFQVANPQISKVVYANNWVDVTVNGYVEEDAWVGLYPNGTTGSISSPSIAWHYASKEFTSRQNYGDLQYVAHIRFDISSANISNPTAYQVVLFIGDNYNQASVKRIAATYQHIDVMTKYTAVNYGNYKISTGNVLKYGIGDEIRIDFSGVTDKDAWIGLYPENVTNYNSCTTGMWVYTATGNQWGMNGAYWDKIPKNGTVYLHANYLDVDTGTIRDTPVGNYKLVLFGDGGYTSVKSVIPIEISYYAS